MTCKISQFIMQLIVVGKNKTAKGAGKAMAHRELLTTAITVRRKIRRGVGIMEIEGITELLSREFCAMVKQRHTSQPGTSSMTMENSMASLRRQGSDYLSEQVIVVFCSPGSKFAAYSTKLSKVVSGVKGRKATMEHREECKRQGPGCSCNHQKPWDLGEPGQRMSLGEDPELCKEQ